MTDQRLRTLIAIRERAYTEGDTQTVKECDAILDEHYREGAEKAKQYMSERNFHITLN